jgi:hypothetical protein
MAKAPDIRSAVNTVTNAHDKCLLLRHILKNADGITLDGEKLRGLGHVFEDLMTDLESIMSDLDPA